MTMTQAEAIEFYTHFNAGEFGESASDRAWSRFVDAMGKAAPEYHMDGVFLDCGYDLFKEGKSPKQAAAEIIATWPEHLSELLKEAV